MKIVSFNINSIRARPHQLEYIRDNLDPDVIGLQETKVNDPDYPEELINSIGYKSHYWGQKGHYGVALLTKIDPLDIQKGFKDDTLEDQKRFIQGTFSFHGKELVIMNGYFPQGENREHPTKFPKKVKFYTDLDRHIKKVKRSNKNIIVMGDFNVAPTANDIGIGEINAKRWLREGKCAFLPEEISMYNKILNQGFIDSWRTKYPKTNDIYSWFDYRSRMFDDNPKRGLRIDHILVSDALRNQIKSVGISYEARALEKPSDHCPIWLYLS
tara:strand:+ start:3565 stop:4374 length:810 start_codon:yes stop_codon:yes gene_type:complete